jgi:beta-mannanase
MLAAAVLVATAAVGSTVPTGGAGAAQGPIAWGATVRASGTQTTLDAVHAFETKVGRKLAATRDFLSWDSPFPTSYENGLKADGTTVLLSVATSRIAGGQIKWASIAAATITSQVYLDMKSWADRIRDFGAPIYVTLQHEPEASTKTSLGTSADYIAAWRKWVSVLRAEGATNAKTMWITTAFAHKLGTADRRQAAKWYPGDDVVDAMAVDAYNWYTCRATVKNPWNSLQQLLSGFMTFAAKHPNPEMWLAEYASVEDPAQAGRKAQWLRDARASLQTAPYARFRGVLYFDLNKACDWRIETVPGTLTEFTTMGKDPYFQG